MGIRTATGRRTSPPRARSRGWGIRDRRRGDRHHRRWSGRLSRQRLHHRHRRHLPRRAPPGAGADRPRQLSEVRAFCLGGRHELGLRRAAHREVYVGGDIGVPNNCGSTGRVPRVRGPVAPFPTPPSPSSIAATSRAPSRSIWRTRSTSRACVRAPAAARLVRLRWRGEIASMSTSPRLRPARDRSGVLNFSCLTSATRPRLRRHRDQLQRHGPHARPDRREPAGEPVQRAHLLRERRARAGTLDGHSARSLSIFATMTSSYAITSTRAHRLR